MTQRLGFLQALGLAGALLTAAGARPATAGSYSIDILINPDHPGIADSWLFDINNKGQSVGYIINGTPSGPRNAVVYRDGDVTVVGNEPGTLRAINSQGDTVGDFNFVPRFIATDGSVTPIEVPGFDASLFVGSYRTKQLNDFDSVLVNVYPFDPVDMSPGAFSGLVIWNPAGIQALSSLDPLYPYVNPPDPDDFNSGPSSFSYTSQVTGLNDTNQFAAGVHLSGFDPMDPLNPDDDVYTDTFTGAYRYDGHGGYQLLESATPGDEIRPIDIDESGAVLGWAGEQLAQWGSDGSLQAILPAPGTTLRSGSTVQRNSLGQIVGVTVDGGVLLYDPAVNAWTDLTPLIAGLGTGTFSTIQGFNDLGQFVGLVRPPQGGGIFGYVVSPIPEPSSLAIFGIGLLFAALRVNRRHKRGD